MSTTEPLTQFGRAQGFRAKLQTTARLIGVVLLQDMRTRYGGRNHFGYLAGVAPYLLCLYPARQMCGAINENRQLLNIPMLQPLHLIVSRAILEFLSAIVALLLFIGFLQFLEVDLWPNDLVEAAKAIGAAIFLGVGLGFFNLVMTALVGHFYQMAFTFLIIGLYITAGVYFPVWNMPEELRDYAVFNPILQLVEWLRSAYYTSYDGDAINRTLVIGVGATALTLGLLGERFLRGKFLS
jgi:capsular polysaccharide transport system permease protein